METMIWFSFHIQLLTAVHGIEVMSFGELKYEVAWDVSNRTDFKFRVACERDVLLSVSDDSYSNGYGITIGGNGNTLTSLRPCLSCSPIDSTKVYKSPLSLLTLKDFWIDWSGTTLRLGAGPVTGEDIYFEYDNMSRIMLPQKIYLGTTASRSSSWEIPDYQIFTMPAPPRNMYSYIAQWSLAGVHSIKLSIKTCGIIVVMLFDNIFDAPAYTITMGMCPFNPCSSIIAKTSHSSTVPINPLSCSQYVPVWMDWSNSSDIIDVGIGNQQHKNTLVSLAHNSKFSEMNLLVIDSKQESRWKADIYGCDYTAWEAWTSLSKCGPEGRSHVRKCACLCKSPPNTGSFNADLYCDGYNAEETHDQSLVCKEWRFIDNHSSPSIPKSTTIERSKIECAITCQLLGSCEVFSYNVSSKECFVYYDPYFDTLFTSPGVRTYGNID